MPRLINVICDRALLGAYSRESRRVDRRLVRRAADEVRGQLRQNSWLRPTAIAATVAALAIIAATTWWVTQQPVSLPAAKPVSPAVVATDARAGELPETTASLAVAAADAPADELTDATANPAAAPAETPHSLHEQLQLAADLTNASSALTTLFAAWGLDYKAGGQSGCSQAADAGLACFYQRGSWSGLRQMDRPAILTLVDNDGGSHEVVLTAINGDSAELSIGGVRTTHPVDALRDAWFGQYLLLWRPTGGVPRSLGPSSRGRDVLWLRNSLAAIDTQFASSNPDSNVFDDELRQRVRDFQRAHRLKVDGVAGQQTQIVINSLLAADGTPRLIIPRLAQD